MKTPYFSRASSFGKDHLGESNALGTESNFQIPFDTRVQGRDSETTSRQGHKQRSRTCHEGDKAGLHVILDNAHTFIRHMSCVSGRFSRVRVQNCCKELAQVSVEKYIRRDQAAVMRSVRLPYGIWVRQSTADVSS
jgi:hypothetical protein